MNYNPKIPARLLICTLLLSSQACVQRQQEETEPETTTEGVGDPAATPCGSKVAKVTPLTWTTGVPGFTLSTEETVKGARNAPRQPDPKQSSKNFKWDIVVSDFIAKLEEEGLTPPKGKLVTSNKILWAECNPRTGKTVVITEFSEPTKNGRHMGLFVAHALWGTIEAFTMPNVDGTRQIYVPWGTPLDKWQGGTEPRLKTWWTSQKTKPKLVKLQSVYLPENKTNPDVKMNLHSGYWNIELPSQAKGYTGVKCNPPTAVAGRPSQFVAGRLPTDKATGRTRGFYFQGNNAVTIRHCDGKGNYATVEFTPVLEFIQCTPSNPSASYLCGGKALLNKPL